MGARAATDGAAISEATLDVQRYRREPEALGRMQLGRFSNTGVRNLLMRRLLLRLPALVRTLAPIAALAPASAAGKARELRAEVAYWHSARSALSEPEWESLTSGPVILMYHAIGAPGESPSRYVIERASFERQVRWLRDRGYTLVTLRQLAEARETGLAPPHSVVLTFDDGYRDNVDALLSIGEPATVFVVTGAVGTANCWDPEGALRGRTLFGWDEARMLASQGIEVGGHSRTHPDLTGVERERMVAEVRGSLQDLRRELGPGSYTFAYPHGRFDEATREAVERANVAAQDARFSGACGSQGGVNDPFVHRYALRRIEIKGTDSFRSFRLMVRLGRRITPFQLLRNLWVG